MLYPPQGRLPETAAEAARGPGAWRQVRGEGHLASSAFPESAISALWALKSRKRGSCGGASQPNPYSPFIWAAAVAPLYFLAIPGT